MKTQTTKKCLMASLLVAGIVTVAISSPISPWDGVGINQTIDRYWTYNFDDGQLGNPTEIIEYQTDWPFNPGDPAFTYSGSGDVISIANGQLGIHNASETSTANILIDVPNGADPANIKYFWFAFDYFGNAPGLSFGTDDANSTLVANSLTFTANTTGSHIEGYVNFLPQPDNEWINISLTADAGESAWIDNLAVGSHCETIPEPMSVAMLLMVYPMMILRRNICSEKKGTGKLYIHINKLFSYLYTVK